MTPKWNAVPLAVLLALGGAAAGEEAAPETRVRGEVVDLHCHLTRGAKGPEHAGCASACIGRGVAPGLLAEDGRLYLLLGERPFPIKDQVAGLAGQTVTVRAVPVERGGLRGLQVKAIEPTVIEPTESQKPAPRG